VSASVNQRAIRLVKVAALAGLCFVTFLRASAADSSCSLTGVRRSGPLSYPAMGRAARVSGDVSLTATFNKDGKTVSVVANSGPAMLRQSAVQYIMTWIANETPSGQTCQIVISFKMEGEANCDLHESRVTMSSPTKLQVTIRPTWTCDPRSTITRTYHRFLFLHWYSHPKQAPYV
jgi:hypothetical protein